MKGVFKNDIEIEANETRLVINGRELTLVEAYQLQRWVNQCIVDIEETHRRKLPFWKRLF